MDRSIGDTHTIAVKAVFVENALPKGRRDLVTCLTTGESVQHQKAQGLCQSHCFLMLGETSTTYVMSSRMIVGEKGVRV